MISLVPGARLILASQSPRRRELLTGVGLAFEVCPADVDESLIDGEGPEQMVQRLSQAKAELVAQANPQAWVIGADTTVVLNHEILGKPNDPAEAVQMLSKIAGREHVVWGGISLICWAKGISRQRTDSSKVGLVQLSEQQISAYVKTGEPLDKAGSYAIQGIGAALVERVDGSYTNVVGLNLAATIQMLRAEGLIVDG